MSARTQLARGILAGLAGTALMTAWQARAAQLRSSGEQPEPAGSEGGDPWERAPVPAKVARRLLAQTLGHDIPADQIPLLTNVMHWGYGTAWGVPFSLLASLTHRARLSDGLRHGLLVWGASYAELVPMGLYQPPWEYPPEDLAFDLSYHLAYGLGVATAFKLLGGGRAVRRRRDS